jgi:atypical dual specificity phosphatase
MTLFHWLFDKIFPITRFIYEKVRGHAWVDQITPDLWLGGAPLYKRDYDFILNNDIQAVLNIRAERDDDEALYAKNNITYKKVEVLDMIVPPLPAIDESVAWMREQIEDGRSVFIHCAKGRSRSATLIAAYLVKYENMTIDQAHQLMLKKRKLTNLRPWHLERVQEWQAQQ